MHYFKIRLLGGVSIVSVEDQDVIDLPGKALELIIYLLLLSQKQYHREQLAALLWPDASASQSRKYLRQALWQIQSQMKSDQIRSVLLSDTQWLRLNPEMLIWTDVAHMKYIYNKVKHIPSSDLGPEQYRALQQASKLYQGELLPGWYHNWCMVERERLRSLYLAMMDKMIDYCLAARRYEQGVQHGLVMLHHDITREKTHRRLMRMYYLSGDRSSALRHYQQVESLLAQELQVRPTAATQELFEQILHEKIPRDVAPPHTKSDAVLPSQTPHILAELERINTHLNGIKQDLNQLKPHQ